MFHPREDYTGSWTLPACNHFSLQSAMEVVCKVHRMTAVKAFQCAKGQLLNKVLGVTVAQECNLSARTLLAGTLISHTLRTVQCICAVTGCSLISLLLALSADVSTPLEVHGETVHDNDESGYARGKYNTL